MPAFHGMWTLQALSPPCASNKDCVFLCVFHELTLPTQRNQILLGSFSLVTDIFNLLPIPCIHLSLSAAWLQTFPVFELVIQGAFSSHHIDEMKMEGFWLLLKIIFNLTILGQTAILGFYPLHEKIM